MSGKRYSEEFKVEAVCQVTGHGPKVSDVTGLRPGHRGWLGGCWRVSYHLFIEIEVVAVQGARACAAANAAGTRGSFRTRRAATPALPVLVLSVIEDPRGVAIRLGAYRIATVGLVFFELDGPRTLFPLSVIVKNSSASSQMMFASEAIESLAKRPSLHYASNDDGLLIEGITEDDIASAIAELRSRYGAHLDIGQVLVAYRETIKESIEIEEKSARLRERQYAHLMLKVEPDSRGSGFEFIDDVHRAVVPEQYIPSIERGVRSALVRSPVYGHPVTDLRVTLYFGSFHETDSNAEIFEKTATDAMQHALERAGTLLLERILFLEVTTPEEYAGLIAGDLSKRRGMILEMHDIGTKKILRANVPVAELFGYATDLEGLTDRKGSYTARFAGYDKAPDDPGPDGTEPASVAIRVA